MDPKSKIYLISGPTASGKSEFAYKLAKKINGEIINADSMQVYKEFNVLTARPKEEYLKNKKHYLYGFHSVKKSFSTGTWLKLVKEKILMIKKKRRVPILVGGTGLYFKALTDGLVKIPRIPLKTRNEIVLLQKNLGQKKFYKKLLKKDPIVKNRIKSNDIQRSIRAYEVKHQTQKSIFKWHKETKPIFDKRIFNKIYIDYPREQLIKNIYKRTENMLKEGAIHEVEKFLRMGIKKNLSSNRIIGISEIKQLLENKLNRDQIYELISIKTRQYAKRQKTWSRGHMKDWVKLSPNDIPKFLKKI